MSLKGASLRSSAENLGAAAPKVQGLRRKGQEAYLLDGVSFEGERLVQDRLRGEQRRETAEIRSEGIFRQARRKEAGDNGKKGITRKGKMKQQGDHIMKIRPLHDRVLIKRITEEEKTKGGIIIPD